MKWTRGANQPLYVLLLMFPTLLFHLTAYELLFKVSCKASAKGAHPSDFITDAWLHACGPAQTTRCGWLGHLELSSAASFFAFSWALIVSCERTSATKTRSSKPLFCSKCDRVETIPTCVQRLLKPALSLPYQGECLPMSPRPQRCFTHWSLNSVLLLSVGWPQCPAHKQIRSPHHEQMIGVEMQSDAFRVTMDVRMRCPSLCVWWDGLSFRRSMFNLQKKGRTRLVDLCTT